MSAIPRVKAQEPEEEEEVDLVDPHNTLKEECAQKPKCVSLKERLDECNARVMSKSETSETCVEELLDFVHCVDHCAAHDVLKFLK